MALLARAIIDEGKIETAVRQVEAEFQPDVERIRYDIGEDWSGDPAINFRVVLSDDASRIERLHKVADRVRERLEDAIQPYDMGLIPYASFRSHSEQQELQEDGWN